MPQNYPRGREEIISDRPLNYHPDQASDIRQRLRQLKVDQVVARIGPAKAAMFLGMALGFLFRRRLTTASLLVLGYIFQRRVKERRSRLPSLGRDDKAEIELEQYALKAQRGDYGKLEVIPFR